ncbi:MAG: hypothetical protein M3347_07790 [Armatimonadota bacterium]|nr:hypothetical protein [Armatimonadota bacterium]
MPRLRLGIIGAGALTEWAILPALSGPDAVAPPDTGAWWGRRPGPHSEIHYQAPAWPEVVALADADPKGDPRHAERVAEAARVRAVYADWRLMLREVDLDALLCAASPEVAAEVAVAAAALPIGSSLRWLWIEGPPAPATDAVLRLAQQLKGHRLRLWCARPLRLAAAHRAARRFLERDHVGAVSALSLRWGTPLHVLEGEKAKRSAGARDDAYYLASSYAALDLLLGLSVPSGAGAAPLQVLAGTCHGATSLWVRLASGCTATALFSAAESWSSTLPRLEICGTEGRSLICEAGRRLWLHEPREAARLLEPPGLAAHVSMANILGVAEDLKAFITACAESSSGTDDGVGNADALLGPARALQLIEAASASLASDALVEIAPIRWERPVPTTDSTPTAKEATKKDTGAPIATLPLHL